jgi:type IV pilus assembly protein PilE
MTKVRKISSQIANGGFTLMELMIVMVIVVVLAMAALPSYLDSVRRSRRAAAQSEMMDIANRQQQYFLAKRSYADKSTLEANGYSLPSEVGEHYSYDIALVSGPPPAFTINFTGQGAQYADGTISLNSAGEKSPPDKW